MATDLDEPKQSAPGHRRLRGMIFKRLCKSGAILYGRTARLGRCAAASQLGFGSPFLMGLSPRPWHHYGWRASTPMDDTLSGITGTGKFAGMCGSCRPRPRRWPSHRRFDQAVAQVARAVEIRPRPGAAASPQGSDFRVAAGFGGGEAVALRDAEHLRVAQGALVPNGGTGLHQDLV